jgi:short-subunit dehydrogenase
MTNYLIIGASRGIGAVFSRLLPSAGDTTWLVSRSQPNLAEDDGVKRIWIQADLADISASSRIADAIGGQTLDVCLYNAGIWEEYAFSDDYDFTQVPIEETQQIITVNLTSAITCVQKVLPALRRSANGKIIFVGSNAGLANSRHEEVAYAASKFGLRGATHALREVVRQDAIGVTCLNLGDVANFGLAGGVLREPPGQKAVLPSDMIIMLKAIIALSNASLVKEIDLLGMSDAI